MSIEVTVEVTFVVTLERPTGDAEYDRELAQSAADHVVWHSLALTENGADITSRIITDEGDTKAVVEIYE